MVHSRCIHFTKHRQSRAAWTLPDLANGLPSHLRDVEADRKFAWPPVLHPISASAPCVPGTTITGTNMEVGKEKLLG